MIRFVRVDPRLVPEMLGIIPLFIDPNDPRPAAEQIDANYNHGGGWNPIPRFEAIPDKPFACTFPEDKPYMPLAIAKLRQEVIVIYEYSLVGIWQRDGSFEVARLD